jgi:hypothetical protein
MILLLNIYYLLKYYNYGVFGKLALELATKNWVFKCDSWTPTCHLFVVLKVIHILLLEVGITHNIKTYVRSIGN